MNERMNILKRAIATTLYRAIEGAYQLSSSAQDIAQNIVLTNYAAKTVKHMPLASLERFSNQKPGPK